MDEDDFGPDPADKLFDELDDFIDFAKESVKKDGNPDKKFDVRLELMNLMLEEVPENKRIYQQMGESWVAEVKYRGINFICVAGKRKPKFWDEVFEDE